MSGEPSLPSQDIIQFLDEGLREGAIVIRRAPDPGIQASREYSELNPTGRQEHASRQFIGHLKSQASELRAQLENRDKEVAVLRRKEVENAALRVAHRSARWIGGVCAAAVAVGGALVSMYAASDDLRLGIGWGLIIVASLVQLGKSLIDF